MKNGKTNPFVMWFVKITGVIPALLFFKPRIHLAKNAHRRLPKPCIFMSNHTSLMDFPLYFLIFPFRSIRFLMAEVLFKKGKFFSWFLYSLGGVYVDRDAYDFSFVSDTIELLDKGKTVGIFPEGRLPLNGKHYPFKPSVVYIALHTDAPIVPVYTAGKYSFFKRADIVIGEEINVRDMCKSAEPTEEEIAEITKKLEEITYSLASEIKVKGDKK